MPEETPERIAERASLDAFVNAYLREIRDGSWYEPRAWQARYGAVLSGTERHVVEIDLPSISQTIALGVRFRSRVARHAFTVAYRQRGARREFQEIDGLSVALALIDEIYADRPRAGARLEMIGRLVESRQSMARYVAAQLERGAEEPRDFIASEQSSVLGHWLHPSPKSRQGFLGYHHDHYAPELGGRFQLHFFAADARMVDHVSVTGVSADELTRSLARRGLEVGAYERLIARLGDDVRLLPIHPLQAEWLVHQGYVRDLIAEGRLVDLGRLGPLFTATSSVRSIYCETEPHMLKVSIPVKITNSLRINLRNELGDGVWLSELFRRCNLASEFPRLRIVDDPAYITLTLPDREETGFEVIFRSNPFRSAPADDAGGRVHAILSLVQDPLRDGDRSTLESVVRRYASGEALDVHVASVRWFERYLACAVEPVIGMLDRYGIALEAHQQNVLVELDATGLPDVAYCRDTQGIGIAESFRERHIAMVPELVAQNKVFESDEIVLNGVGYYLVFNQLFAVIHRFALDGLASEEALIEITRRRLRALRPAMRGLGAEFVDGLLGRPTLPFKGNLLTRVADVDELEAENELAVYTRVENPLAVAAKSAFVEEHAGQR